MQDVLKPYSLSKGEISVLQFISKFGYCHDHHLLLLPNLHLKRPSLNRLIANLIKKGVVTKKLFLRNGGYFILLTKLGSDLFQIPKVKGISLNTLHHDMLVIDLFLHQISEVSDLLIKTDKEQKRELGINFIGNRLNTPDLLINDNIAVEVELTAKPLHRLREVVNSYIVNSQIKEVHYYVKSMAILNRVFALTSISHKFRGFLFTTNIGEAVEVFDKSINNINDITPFSQSRITGVYNLDEYLNK